MRRFAWITFASLSVALSALPALANDEIALPLTGLLVDVPDHPDLAYRVSGTWSLADFGDTFEARDIIDVVRAGERSGSVWVSVGWYAVGRCTEVLATAPLEASWEAPAVALWGARWAMRGGIYRGGGDHDGAPMLTMCVDRGERKQLVMSRFFEPSGGEFARRQVVPPGRSWSRGPRSGPKGAAQASRGTTDTMQLPARARALAAVRKDTLVRRIYRAFHGDRLATTAPARTEGVVNHGVVPARRVVPLFWAGVNVTLPDDGFVWMSGPDLSGVDRFERMAPALPELSLAVALLDVPAPCAAVFRAMEGDPDRAAVKGLPSGWEAGPTARAPPLTVMSVCHELDSGLAVAAIITATKERDLTPVAPLLEAIGRALAPLDDKKVPPADDDDKIDPMGALVLPSGLFERAAMKNSP